jgi:hypothetical protein
MSYDDTVYWVGFLWGTVFGNTIGMLFTVWWLHRTGMLRSSANAGS